MTHDQEAKCSLGGKESSHPVITRPSVISGLGSNASPALMFKDSDFHEMCRNGDGVRLGLILNPCL